MEDNMSIHSNYSSLSSNSKSNNKYQKQIELLEQQQTHDEDVVTNAFKSALKEYIEIDNDLKEANTHLKEIRQRKKDLSSQIQIHMKQFSINRLQLPGSKLSLTSKFKKKPINEKLILERLTIYFKGDEEKAKKLTKFIVDKEARQTNQKSYSLSRRMQKK